MNEYELFEHPDLTVEQIDAAIERQRERIEWRQLQDDADVRDARCS